MSGKIPVEALDEGSRLALRNAWQLLQDAELLLSHGSHGHAVAFAMLAFEEYAKARIFKAMRADASLRDGLAEKIAMRKHVEKFWVSLEGIRAARGQEPTDETKKRIVDTGEKLQTLKERGLYVDYYRKWLTPQSEDLKMTAKQTVSETRVLMSELEKLWGFQAK